MNQTNNILIPVTILLAGAMIAGAVIFIGMNSQPPAPPAERLSGGAAGGDRAIWANPAIHREYAEELGLDADALVACFQEGVHAERVAASTQEGAANGGSGTPYFIVNDIPISGAQPFPVFVQAIEAALAGGNDESIPVSVDTDGWPTLGDADAPVLVVEYSDYACPFCKRAAEQTKPQIVSEYVDAGIVQFVRKDFIAVGGNKAAEAAHCAGDQGAYWEYHDILVARQ